MNARHRRILAALLLLFGCASLLHFVHNAEFLDAYPNLPRTWTRAEVYVTWLTMSLLGVAGWLLVVRGLVTTGLAVLVAYSVVGLESLGHYLRAPFMAHTMTMNASILAEVSAAAAVLMYVIWLLLQRVPRVAAA